MSAIEGPNSAIEDIVARLAAQEKELGAAIKRLEKSLAEQRRQHKSVRAALIELTGNGKKKSVSGRGATTREVIRVIEESLRVNPGLSDEAIKAAVIAHCKGPQTGIHLRIKNAAKDQRFERRGGRWYLRACAEESTHDRMSHDNELARTI